MILQCDQCNTKFRLDDAKLKPGGVKVRCSKCRHVFVAGAEPRQEESDFDAILSGLGAPAPEKTEAPAAGDELDALAARLPPTPASEPQPPPLPEPTVPAAPAASAAAPAASGFEADFGAFEFSPELAAPEKQPAAAAEEKGEFDAFDFAPPEEATAQEASTAPGQEGFSYREFSFEDEPAPLKEETSDATGESFGLGEFAFEAEPAAEPVKAEAEASAAGGGLAFGEIDFNPEPVADIHEQPAARELDFGAFSFEEEPVVKAEEPAAGKDAFDFGDFSFDEEPPPAKEDTAAAAEAPLDFGSISFAEEAAGAKEEAPAASDESFSLGEFSFDEEPVSEPVAEAPAEPPAAPAALAAAVVPEEVMAPAAGVEDLGPAAKPGATAAEQGPPAAPVPPIGETRKTAAAETPLDFDFGSKSFLAGGGAPEAAEEEEELPPLSISSRRKGRSLFTVSLVAVSVLAIVGLTGAGLYLSQSGPAALEKFDKLGLGFVGKWFGMEAPEEGRIVIRNPLASFYQNKEAGELFVVTGEAVNSYRKPRASIHVKVSLFGKNGQVLMQKTAYCGNRLSKEQLETLPMSKIDSIMNNQFGDSLSNLGVKPGQAIGFVVAIPNVPKDAVDFGVEPVGSTVAAQ